MINERTLQKRPNDDDDESQQKIYLKKKKLYEVEMTTHTHALSEPDGTWFMLLDRSGRKLNGVRINLIALLDDLYVTKRV